MIHKSNEELKKELRLIFQEFNLNFLIGSGVSTPFFDTLGIIEKCHSVLEDKRKGFIEKKDKEKYDFAKTHVYNAYFNAAMSGNIELLKLSGQCDLSSILNKKGLCCNKRKLFKTFSDYKVLLKCLNTILYERRSNLASKHVNLFTTNIDIFLEKVLESLDFEFNGGFSGAFKRKFSLSNFRKTIHQKSPHFDNVSEIPVFNLLKIHGSVNWEKVDENIVFSSDLKILRDIKSNIENDSIKIDYDKNPDSIIDDLFKADDNYLRNNKNSTNLLELYNNLQIVMPTKKKIMDTVLDRTYFELLRFYSNELEKKIPYFLHLVIQWLMNI